MDKKKDNEPKDINDISDRLMKNIEDGLSSINVDIGDYESYKKKGMDKEELEAKYQEVTRNLKIDTSLVEEVYEDIIKAEHEKFEKETKEEEDKIEEELGEEENRDKNNEKDVDNTEAESNIDVEKNLESQNDINENVDSSENKEVEEDIGTSEKTESELEVGEVVENNDDEICKNEEDLFGEDDVVNVEKVKFEYRQNPVAELYDKIKGKIDRHFENRRKIKTHNAAMSKVLVAVTCVFFSLIVYIAYYVLIDSKDRLNNPYNERSILMEETVKRGNIYSSDEKILAETIRENNQWKRYYPYGTLFSHVVGRYDKGKTGIELGNDYDLLATDDTQIQKIINDINDEKSNGNSIVTTLNYKLQKVADTALGNRNGAIVAIEPSTGKILAMVSKPNYDPNYIYQDWEKYSNSDNSENALLNRATQGLYAPGSTFKIVTALEYIRNNIYASFQYDCKGICTIDGHNTRCYNTKVHGMQDLKMAFTNSCNTAFANIGMNLKISEYNKTCEKLLFNRDLPFDYSYKGSSFDLVDGSKTTLKVDTAIGQGKTQITPLHNALIVSAIANKGELMKPYVVDKIVSEDMTVQELTQPKKAATFMNKIEAEVLTDMMISVASEGTAKALKNNFYTVAGKTGSAEYDETNNSHAWFVGFAPASDPTIAVSIIVEKAGTGGTHAVPIAKKMFDAYLQ